MSASIEKETSEGVRGLCIIDIVKIDVQISLEIDSCYYTLRHRVNIINLVWC